MRVLVTGATGFVGAIAAERAATALLAALDGTGRPSIAADLAEGTCRRLLPQ